MNRYNFIFSLIVKYQVHTAKKWSQNFLIDHDVIYQIIKAAKIVKQDVIEIGPGLGSLTFPLLLKAASVTAYEIDPKMQFVLEQEINNTHFHLVKDDFLQAQFQWDQKRPLVASIPYNITTEIIFKLLNNINKFASATLVLQKEVAKSIIARPKTKSYGKLSVSLQSVAHIEEVMVVKSASFWPPPKVDSMVIKMNFYGHYDQKYFRFILRCFAYKRKTLFNNLKLFVDQNQIDLVFAKMNLASNVRSQQLSVADFKKLWHYLQ